MKPYLLLVLLLAGCSEPLPETEWSKLIKKCAPLLDGPNDPTPDVFRDCMGWGPPLPTEQCASDLPPPEYTGCPVESVSCYCGEMDEDRAARYMTPEKWDVFVPDTDDLVIEGFDCMGSIRRTGNRLICDRSQTQNITDGDQGTESR